MTDHPETFGSFLKAAMDAVGMSRDTLAERVTADVPDFGVTGGAVLHYLNDRRCPAAPVIVAMARALDLGALGRQRLLDLAAELAVKVRREGVGRRADLPRAAGE